MERKDVWKTVVKAIFIVLLVVALVGGVLFLQLQKDKYARTGITVMSYNIRCIAIDDTGERAWSARSPLVEEIIRKNDPDVIGFQEVTEMHESFLRKTFPGYTFNVAYREEHLFHEGVAIAYKTDKFTQEKEGMFWLSKTPEVKSKDWDSNMYRVANYVVLTERETGEKITFVSTHLDNEGKDARQKQMEVVLEQMEKVAEGKWILVGDMNGYDDSPMYKAATDKLTDAMTVAENVYEGKTGATYQGYGASLNERRIDYCFVTNGTKITSFVVDDTTYNGVYPSDHFPLVVKIAL